MVDHRSGPAAAPPRAGAGRAPARGEHGAAVAARGRRAGRRRPAAGPAASRPGGQPTPGRHGPDGVRRRVGAAGRERRPPPGARASSATPGSPPPAPPPTGTGSRSPPATGCCSAPRCGPGAAATCAPSASPPGCAARSAWPPGRRPSTSPGTVRSLPPFESRKHLPSRLARLRELDGRAAIRVRGQGTEFDSLREYVRGDDVRSIDWRASARNRNVVVRTWQPERDRRVVLVLDTSRTSAGRVEDVPRLDSAMDAALLLAALAARAGDRIDFVAGDRRVRARLRSARRTRRGRQPPGHDGRPRAGHRRGRLVGAGRRGDPVRPAAGAGRAADPARAVRGRGGAAAGAARR